MKIQGKQLADTLRSSTNAFTNVYSNKLTTTSIESVSNNNIDLVPGGTGSTVIKGNSTSGSGHIVLNCENNSHGITLKGPPHSANASYTLTLPNTDGNANEVLKTDGSGNLDWLSVGTSANDIVQLDGSSKLPAVDGSQLTGVTVNSAIDLADNVKIRLGTGNDFEFFHDGTNSIIKDNASSGGSTMKYLAGTQTFQNKDANKTMAVFNASGAIDLHYDGVKKFETMSAGVKTTGTLNINSAYAFPTSDGNANQVLSTDGSGSLSFVDSSSSSDFVALTGDVSRADFTISQYYTVYGETSQRSIFLPNNHEGDDINNDFVGKRITIENRGTSTVRVLLRYSDTTGSRLYHDLSAAGSFQYNQFAVTISGIAYRYFDIPSKHLYRIHAIQTNATTVTYWNVEDLQPSIDTIEDVELTSLANNQTLAYNSTSEKWENVPLDMVVEAKTANFTAVENYFYLVSGSSGSTIGVTLPSPTTAGKRIKVFNHGDGVVKLLDPGTQIAIDPNDASNNTVYTSERTVNSRALVELVSTSSTTWEYVIIPQLELDESTLTTTGQVFAYNSTELAMKALPYTFPSADGSASGQVLSTNASGALSFTTVTATDSTKLAIANNLSDLANDGTARTNLGVAIGSDVQAYDAQLTDIASLATTDSGFIVGNGSTFVLESGATVRTSLGLGTSAVEDVGTSANNVVQLDGNAKLPAVDGSQLTNLPSGGGLTYSAINANTTAQANYHYSATGTITVTLPTASGTNAGEQINVKNKGTGTITINRSGSDTIDGATSYTMSIQYEAVSFISNGSNGYEIV